MQSYLDKENHDITPLLMSLKTKTVMRMRTRMITRDLTSLSSLTEVIEISTH